MTTCKRCSSNNFDVKDGSYVCNNCGTLCTDIIDEVAYDDYEDLIASASASSRSELKVAKGRQSKNHIDFGSNWTSFEAFNVILKKQVDSLIGLGVSKLLKPIVLQLWMKYLEKLGVIRFNEPPDGKKLKCNFYVRKCDRAYFTSAKKPRVRPKMSLRQNRKVSRRQERLAERRLKMFGLNERKTIRRTRDDLSFLTQTEMDVPAAAPSFSEISAFGYLSDDHLSVTTDSEEAAPEPPLRLSSILSKTGKRLHKIKSWRLGYHVQYMKLRWTLAFLYLGLLMLRSKLLLSDLVRLTWTGHVPFRMAAFCLPMSMKFQAFDNVTFRAHGIQLYDDLRHWTRHLANYVGVSKLPHKCVEEIVARLLIDFDLPECLFDRVRCLMAAYRERKYRGSGNVKKIPNYEGRAAAFIVLALKLLFGLDDKTEWGLDRYCAKLEERKLMRLFGAEPPFKWGDWMVHTMTKQAIINGTFIRSLRDDTNCRLFRENLAGNFHRKEGHLWRGRHCVNHKKMFPTDVPEMRQNILYTVNSLPKDPASSDAEVPVTKPTSFPFTSEFKESIKQMKDCHDLREELLNRSFRRTSIAYVVRSMGYREDDADGSTEVVSEMDLKKLMRLRVKYGWCFNLAQEYVSVKCPQQQKESIHKHLSYSLNWLIGLFSGFLEMTAEEVYEEIGVVEAEIHRLGRIY